MTRFELSVSKKHKKVMDIIDSWKQKGNAGDKICGLIEKAFNEEQKGSKITAFNGEQSKLPLLPPVYESLKPEDLVGLTYDEKRTIWYALGQSLTVVEKDIRKAEAQR